MRRIPRNPAKFDVFELFHALAEQKGFSVRAPRADERFLDVVADSLRRHKNDPRLVYGKRTEFMFSFVAASLGKARVIRQEDAGEMFVSESDIQPPDYRIVLQDGLEFFAEVKNYRPAEATSPFTLSTDYVVRLEKYASAFNKEVKVAIYWNRWNIWTLIPLNRFLRDEKTISIEMGTALKYNEMSILGDYMVAMRPPLELRIVADPQKTRFVDRDGRCQFTIRGIEIYAGTTRIEDSFEKQLAFSFLLYGRWEETRREAKVIDRLLSYLSLVVAPEKRNPDQEFAAVDYLSGLMSARYRAATTSSRDGAVVMRPTAPPDFLDFRIPADYRGKQLPLWRFILEPPKEE